ncbi:MAG TPA: glycosyltransferase, partial [Sphingobacteriaceae bacterium]
IGKVASKCNRDVVLFPNWVDTRSFFPLDEKARLKTEFSFKPTDTVVLYSGAVGRKQGLDTILHAARSLSGIPGLKFVICGTGPYLQELKDLNEELALDNVLFMPLQPTRVLNRFLNMADIHLVIQKKEASDLVMPSKLTNILATGGVSIVTAEKGSSLYQIIERHRIGIVAEPENPNALARAVSRAIRGDLAEIRSNARHYAMHSLSIDKVMVRYANHLKEIAGLPVRGVTANA